MLLREIIKHFGGKPSFRLAVTASTGIAAVNIGGCTVHSWAGIGLGDDKAEKYVGKFFKNEGFRSVRDRWKYVETIIIDESMSSL